VSSTPLPGPEGGEPLTVTVSIGVATLGVDAEDVPGLLEKADAALYEAKRLGRDRVATAAPASRASA
jgi:diguanylate cyclase (GGDEF)-like protein